MKKNKVANAPKILRSLSPEKTKNLHRSGVRYQNLPEINDDVKACAEYYFYQNMPLKDEMKVLGVRKLKQQEIKELQASIRDVRMRTDTALQTITHLKKQMISKSRRIECLTNEIGVLQQEAVDNMERNAIARNKFVDLYFGDAVKSDMLYQCVKRRAQLIAFYDKLLQEVNCQSLVLYQGIMAKKLICQSIFAIKVRSFTYFLLDHHFDSKVLERTISFCREVVHAIVSINTLDIGRCEQLMLIFHKLGLVACSAEIQEAHRFLYFFCTKFGAGFGGVDFIVPYSMLPKATQLTVAALIENVIETEDFTGYAVSRLKATFCPQFACTARHYELVHRYIKFMYEYAIMHSYKAHYLAMQAQHDAEEDEIERVADDLKVCELRQLTCNFEAKIEEMRARIDACINDKMYHALPIEKFSDEMLADEKNAIHIYEAQYNGVSREQIKLEYQSLQFDVLKAAILNNLTKSREQILCKQASTSQVQSIDLILKQTDDTLRITTQQFLQIENYLYVQHAKRLVFQENADILHEIKMRELAAEPLEEAAPAKAKEKHHTKTKEMYRTWAAHKTQTVRNIAVREAVQHESKIVENDFYK